MLQRDTVQVVEVGPRDGLQSEVRCLSLSQRQWMIEQLIAAGVERLEVGSFVSPRRVPQMADTDQLLQRLHTGGGLDSVKTSALVANQQGLQQALVAPPQQVALFTAATDEFCRANIGCDVDTSLQRFADLATQVRQAGLQVRGYLSCAVYCPFTGRVAVKQVIERVLALQQIGCDDISLGDTTGQARPTQWLTLLNLLARELPIDKLTLHCHDTYGQALANVYAALELGIRRFDSSVAGLGGCPYAPGASGNLATEDLLYLLEGCGLETGINRQAVAAVGAQVCQWLGHSSDSKVAQAMESHT